MKLGEPHAAPVPLEQLDLDEQALDQLFVDVRSSAELIEIVIKGGALEHSDASPPDLAVARELLRERRVAGVQLRYRVGGVEWWDTLMSTPDGVRLIRMDRSADM